MKTNISERKKYEIVVAFTSEQKEELITLRQKLNNVSEELKFAERQHYEMFPPPNNSLDVLRRVENQYAEIISKINDFVSNLTKGRYPNDKNMYHVYNGHNVGSSTNFNPDEIIDPQKMRGGLYFVNKKTHYLYTFKPLIIFSPKNPVLRRFIRMYDSGKYSKQKIDDFIRDKDQTINSSEGVFHTKIIVDRKEGGNLSWSRIADCIVDFDAGKVYFYS